MKLRYLVKTIITAALLNSFDAHSNESELEEILLKTTEKTQEYKDKFNEIMKSEYDALDLKNLHSLYIADLFSIPILIKKEEYSEELNSKISKILKNAFDVRELIIKSLFNLFDAQIKEAELNKLLQKIAEKTQEYREKYYTIIKSKEEVQDFKKLFDNYMLEYFSVPQFEKSSEYSIELNSKIDKINDAAMTLAEWMFFSDVKLNNNIIYLIKDETGMTKGKVAFDWKRNQTFGGVTGNLNDLTDFSIKIEDLNLQSENLNAQLQIEPEKWYEPYCNQVDFAINNDSIVAISFPESVPTATSCTYNILDENLDKIASFQILLNHTYKYWCQAETQAPEAFKTAQSINKCNNLNEDDIITEIDLKNKGIKDISPITGFYHLQKIYLSENQIQTLPPQIFHSFKFLRAINLDNNQINLLPKNSFDNNKILNTLNLSKNKITSLPKEIFDKSIYLESLTLDHNQISSLNEKIFDKLKKLHYLNLSNNQIQIIPKNFFKQLHKNIGFSLYIEGNPINN